MSVRSLNTLFGNEHVLNKQYNINHHFSEYSNNTLLHIAVINNEHDIVKKIIQQKGDVNAINSLNKTPLHYAMHTNNFDIIKMLIDSGGNVHAQDIFGNIPLFYATSIDLFGNIAPCNQTRINIIQLLLLHSLNIDIKNINKVNIANMLENILQMMVKQQVIQQTYDYIKMCNQAGIHSKDNLR